jgi:hypothetical protein
MIRYELRFTGVLHLCLHDDARTGAELLEDVQVLAAEARIALPRIVIESSSPARVRLRAREAGEGLRERLPAIEAWLAARCAQVSARDVRPDPWEDPRFAEQHARVMREHALAKVPDRWRVPNSLVWDGARRAFSREGTNT